MYYERDDAMKIELKSITITNFKGIKHKEVDFSPYTEISGQNGECKTTVFDALIWHWFNKICFIS